MFKLESFLSPWLFSYLDKYIKLRPDDFKLSLWEGDFVLHKLDLRLDAIESLISLPIAFKSGIINELSVHIPWTKINSEPVIITINTLEFVAKLKNHQPEAFRSQGQKPYDTTAKYFTEESTISRNYIQSVIDKVIFNLSIVINNIIIKLVDDDIVLSLNIKSVELFNANSSWEKAFTDINGKDSKLKKICHINDLTLCLDKRDSTGKIDFFQDPVMYVHINLMNHKL